jgi:hypothetical protein
VQCQAPATIGLEVDVQRGVCRRGRPLGSVPVGWRRLRVGWRREEAEADIGAGGGWVDDDVAGHLADHAQATAAVVVVGRFGAPAAEVAYLDLDRAVAAVGELVGELARFVRGEVGVLGGVRGGFPEGDVEVLAEFGGQCGGADPGAHGAAQAGQLGGVGGQPLTQGPGQVAGGDQGDVVGGPGLGQRVGEQLGDQGVGRLAVQRRGVNYGPFETVLDLPTGYELARAKAIYVNGFLRVDVPPVHESQSKTTKVPISDGE